MHFPHSSLPWPRWSLADPRQWAPNTPASPPHSRPSPESVCTPSSASGWTQKLEKSCTIKVFYCKWTALSLRFCKPRQGPKSFTRQHMFAHASGQPIGSNLGFSAFPKDTLMCGQSELGLDMPTVKSLIGLLVLINVTFKSHFTDWKQLIHRVNLVTNTSVDHEDNMLQTMKCIWRRRPKDHRL